MTYLIVLAYKLKTTDIAKLGKGGKYLKKKQHGIQALCQCNFAL